MVVDFYSFPGRFSELFSRGFCRAKGPMTAYRSPVPAQEAASPAPRPLGKGVRRDAPPLSWYLGSMEEISVIELCQTIGLALSDGFWRQF